MSYTQKHPSLPKSMKFLKPKVDLIPNLDHEIKKNKNMKTTSARQEFG